MALITGRCSRCNQVIQLEGSGKVGFCSFCGSKIGVEEAKLSYEKLQREQNITVSATTPDGVESTFAEANAALGNGKYDLAHKLFGEILAGEAGNVKAQWGSILAKTHNLKHSAIRNLDDYAYTEAKALFDTGNAAIEPEWSATYWEALDGSCRMSVESVDPRVFLELKIYQWYPNSNTFLYPISKDFNIQPILDKELLTEWRKMSEALPPDKQDGFNELCESCCRRIREYFQSGFANMAEVRNGDLSRLMGTWMLKLTTGAQKNEVLSFTQNPAGVPHMEAYRTAVNGYDYYRYIKVDENNRVTAAEQRHFPSATGLGGDFLHLDASSPVLGLMAVYEYILILPTALYSRTEPNKIPNHGRAVAFIEKCRTMPCFARSENLKNTFQMKPIAENHESGEPSKKMKHCYIATAVYGDIEAPEVCRLRRYRDESLIHSRPGRLFVKLYYKFSPKLAQRLSPEGRFSRCIRRMLDVFVKRLGD
ncbi:MAG: hypothetical protein FWG31_01690 [Oscillospiraceae bacterium]|nr:hypothetical protein [Oscillospiraceae bacterium]